MKRIRNYSRLLVFLFLSVFILSCDDIFEKDLTNDTVLLLAPSDEFITSEKSVKLDWEILEGAAQYRLRVATPSLNNADIIKLDTILTSTTYNIVLTTGAWQWCVKAQNSGYETQYVCRNLTIL